MNVLLLSNGAPNYFNFFNALANCFARDGATVSVAVDCSFSREENRLDALGFEIYDFSAFYLSHQVDRSILARYATYDLNAALLSDFERAEVYGIWGNEIDIGYYDRLKSALLSYFEGIYERRGIDVVIYENVSNTFSHFALFVAQCKGLIYCGIGGSRLPGRFSITNDPLCDDQTARTFCDIRNGRINVDQELRQWAVEYIATIETAVPDYMKINGLDQVGLLSRYLRLDRLSKVKSLLRHVFDSRTEAFQVGNPLRTHANLFFRNVRRRLKIGRLRHFYQEPVLGEKFLLYPMHFHPESSTSILAGPYLDEYEVIRNIAFSLPEGVRLYVKDHISAWGYPSLNFYRRIKRLPNVRLLDPKAPTKQLIKASAGVITLSSTVGYEALLLKKRVFLFGRVFYDFHTGVIKIVNPARLREIISDGLAQSVDWDDAYNNDFVCSYYKSTLPGSLNLLLGPNEARCAARHVYNEMLKAGIVKISQESVPS
ncbi:hypothetical protein [uncultured Zoogloea sp.]|uniref:capsular polysaccharide export protein, LipB/KpsS family n=1 Tax=uncultured Zoogloea sp. TaxID=160237 RepID=UPI00261C06C8|nr:hypothetical protein [uncultured Zoogloea sp.]